MSILTQKCSTTTSTTPFLTSIMDTKIDHHLIINNHKLKRLHSLKFPKPATSSSSTTTTTTTQNSDSYAVEDDHNIHRYTSLRDLDMAEGAHDFNCTNISIKNRLVKRAASAYLQSAAILATARNQNCFSSFWEKLTNKASLRTYWRIYVGEPIRACFRPLLRFIPCMVWSPYFTNY